MRDKIQIFIDEIHNKQLILCRTKWWEFKKRQRLQNQINIAILNIVNRL